MNGAKKVKVAGRLVEPREMTVQQVPPFVWRPADGFQELEGGRSWRHYGQRFRTKADVTMRSPPSFGDPLPRWLEQSARAAAHESSPPAAARARCEPASRTRAPARAADRVPPSAGGRRARAAFPRGVLECAPQHQS